MFKISLGVNLVLILLLASVGWYTKNLHADYITAKNNNAVLEAAKKELKEKVEKANATSKEYQKQLSVVDSQLASIRLRDNTPNCIVVDRSERGFNGTGTRSIVSNGNGRSGLSVAWLYDFAGRCEKTRQKAIGLQNFVRSVNE